MNYALAKRLKDGGFPQKEPNGFVGLMNLDVEDKEVYFPTLEQLIKECGESLKQLNNHMDSKWGKKRWTAKSRELDRRIKPRHKDFDGETPTEAVANLWLALKGK